MIALVDVAVENCMMLTGRAGGRIMSWDEAPLVSREQEVQVGGGGDALSVKGRQAECGTPDVELQHINKYPYVACKSDT